MKPISHMRVLTALLSALVLLAGPVLAFPLLATAPASAANTATSGAATGPAGSGSDSPDGSEISITLDEVTPWIDEEGTLKVRGLVVNSSDQPIAAPKLSLGMSSRTLAAESSIEAWKTDQSQHRIIADLDDDGPEARKHKGDKDSEDPVTAADAKFGERIAAGASYEFTFSVPAENLGLPTSSPASSWGPRGLSVRLGDATGLRATGVGFTTWYPSPKFDPTKISMLAPVTLPGHNPDGLIAAEDLDEAIADGGSLSTIMSLLRHKELGLALDPRIIASFEAAVAEPAAEDPAEPEPSEEPSGPAGEESPPPDNGEGDASAEEKKAAQERRKRLDSWYHDFLAEAEEHTVIALPFADPDLGSLNGSRLDELGTFAQEQRALVKDVLPQAKTDIAWPLTGTADRAGLRALTADGNTTAILSDSQQPPTSGIHENAHSQATITPDGQSTIETLVSDSGLAERSVGAISADHPASALSELVALSAAVQSEAPYRARHVLVPLPRTAASAGWVDAVRAVSSAPWVDPTDINDLLASESVPRGPLQESTDAKSIGTNVVGSLAGIRKTRARFNTVFTDPQAANERLDRELLSCTSAAWTLGGNANRCANAARAQSQQVMDSLHLKKGSSVLLVTGEKTTIPVTIVNDAPAEAKLKIRMQPQTPQLRAQTTETVTVPPAETMRVDVPVEGLANADVPTRIEMVTTSDVVLPEHETLMVRVRADWENIGTAVVGLALAAVFVIGLIKTIARGRPKIPEQQLADAMARAHTDDSEKR